METSKNQWKAAEVKLTYRNKVKASERSKIGSSKDAYKLLLKNWDKDQIEFVEEFKVILLNSANQVLGIFNASVGGRSGTMADPRVIFAVALKTAANAIILAHNHPSGSLKKSKPDKSLTDKLAAAGSFLDISVLDHLIITREGYYSFADNGEL
ncbi:JAB domain-containing protein [Echinicola marina]|uniref:JAB domain-containing protein n=1 Tax=Echinicola marina TaxID=2859768 RepID=UPI001CF6F653|nr:JAB domain-containing protein [Echinicola marina]UCS94362.1 JAB domain-containing protein [Echinicola marina]